jgi:uncharacterized protein (TIGR02145 family)
MKKHLFLLFLISFSFSNSFGQNKKDQIEQLNYRVDSLVRILDSERIVYKQQKTALEQQIVDLNNSITKLKAQALIDKSSLKTKDEAIVNSASENAKLSAALKEKNDSLQIVLVKLEKLKPPVKIAPVTVVVDNKGPIKGVAIGTQVWTTKNLDVATFRNGDAIPEAKTNKEWEAAGENKQPAWCYYENNTANGTKYGKLYNWYAVSDARGLAPTGYHIPTYTEWTKLSDYLGSNKDLGKKMKSSSGWNDAGNGNNSSGFSGLPGGGRTNNGEFFLVGEHGNWWIASVINEADLRFLYLTFYDSNLYQGSDAKDYGFSVRCVRD